MRGMTFNNVDFTNSTLKDIDFSDVIFAHTRLTHTAWDGMTIGGISPHDIIIYPTAEGWYTSFFQWTGPVQSFLHIISSDPATGSTLINDELGFTPTEDEYKILWAASSLIELYIDTHPQRDTMAEKLTAITESYFDVDDGDLTTITED